jgi:hypothetical protein
MIDIQAVLNKLAKERPIFHAEADFQHALAWEIHKRLGDDARIRLEWPVLLLSQRKYLDIWIDRGNQALAIELKYKTRSPGEIKHKGETFGLGKLRPID